MLSLPLPPPLRSDKLGHLSNDARVTLPEQIEDGT